MRWIKRRLLHWVVGSLYKSVTLRDLNRGFDQLKPALKQAITYQAHQTRDTELNKWLSEEIQRVAMKRMFLEAKNEEDLIFAKAILYAEDVRAKKLDNLAKQAKIK